MHWLGHIFLFFSMPVIFSCSSVLGKDSYHSSPCWLVSYKGRPSLISPTRDSVDSSFASLVVCVISYLKRFVFFYSRISLGVYLQYCSLSGAGQSHGAHLCSQPPIPCGIPQCFDSGKTETSPSESPLKRIYVPLFSLLSQGEVRCFFLIVLCCAGEEEFRHI